jgi:hypothetical protein
MAPLCTVLLAGVGAIVVDLATVRRERARLQATFARYVPPDHVERVATLEATVMFCDLRGWTAIAEVAEPGELLDALNRYLGRRARTSGCTRCAATSSRSSYGPCRELDTSGVTAAHDAAGRWA